jgi:NAD(P)-dependent dehydrogenase (short-subunit alcohol dehydrogenase family)
VLERFGRIDVLVNSAGILRRARLEECTARDWDDVIAVNLRGTFLMCRAVGRAMLERGGGTIVNIASLAGHVPSTGRAAYSVSKAGVRSLTELIAVEWGPRGIRCNSVSPGHTERGMGGAALGEETNTRTGSAIPLRRVAATAEIAEAVLYLASDQSAFVNGVSLVVDGGAVVSTLALIHDRLQ